MAGEGGGVWISSTIHTNTYNTVRKRTARDDDDDLSEKINNNNDNNNNDNGRPGDRDHTHTRN